MDFKYVTIEEVRFHLRYEEDEIEESLLTAYIKASEKAVDQYIKKDVTPEEAPDIKTAVLLLIGYLDQYRNAEKEAPTSGNYLPEPVRMLLSPYRKPTVV